MMNKIRRIEAMVLRALVYISFTITLGILLLIVGFILANGLPNLSPKMFEWTYSTENLSMMPSIINTVIVVAMSLLVAVPFGIFSAIYLNEYARKGSRFVKLVRTMTETLQGVPSIVYGLFGYLFFVKSVVAAIYLNEYARKGSRFVKLVRTMTETLQGVPSIVYGLFGYLFFVKSVVGSYSLLAGALTLSMMVLPLIMRTTEEALNQVSDSYREGSFALGAGKLRTVFSVVLPAAAGGIFAGIVLSIGRMVGETAALIYTAGAVASVPKSVTGMGSTLSVHMYSLYSEGLNGTESYAVAVVLLIMVMVLNGISDFILWRINAKQGKGK